LRPAYNFFGIPLSQLILPYVRNFERARNATADIVENFSLLGLKTDMAQMLQGETADDIINRMKVMLGSKRNYGIAMIDKDTEEFFQINTPLSGLQDLVAQSLELLALVSGEPVTKLFGTPPKGFNSTGEHDLVNFYDRVKNWQENLFYDNFETARKVIELSEFGQTFPDIVSEWQPLKDPNPKEQAEINKILADTDASLVQSGAVDAEDIRRRLSQDVTSGYANIKPEDLPEPPDTPESENPFGGDELKKKITVDAEEDDGWRTAKNGKRYHIDEDGNIDKGNIGQNEGKNSESNISPEIQKKIDSVKIDFDKDNTLPGLNQDDLDYLGMEDKPILFKKDTIDRNEKKHPDITRDEYNELIGQGLYNNDTIIREKHDPLKPNYYHFVKKMEKSNSIVLLEMADNKDNYEIVHVQKMGDKKVKKLKKRNS